MTVYDLFGYLALVVCVLGLCVGVWMILALVFAPNEFFGEDE